MVTFQDYPTLNIWIEQILVLWYAMTCENAPWIKYYLEIKAYVHSPLCTSDEKEIFILYFITYPLF